MSVTTAPTLRRRRGMTEQAATAAIDQACRRLRLPTIRAWSRKPPRSRARTS